MNNEGHEISLKEIAPGRTRTCRGEIEKIVVIHQKAGNYIQGRRESSSPGFEVPHFLEQVLNELA